MNVGDCIHEAPAGLSQAIVVKDEKTPDKFQSDNTLILGTCNHEFYGFSLSSQQETGLLAINGMDLWLSAYTACMDKGFSETVRKGIMFYSSFLDIEQKLLVMLTKRHIHIIFYGNDYVSKMIAPYEGGQVTACIVTSKYSAENSKSFSNNLWSFKRFKSSDKVLPEEKFIIILNQDV